MSRLPDTVICTSRRVASATSPAFRLVIVACGIGVTAAVFLGVFIARTLLGGSF